MATKVGIIGYGWAATAHIDAINGTDQGEVVAVYSSRPLEDTALSEAHGGSIRLANPGEAGAQFVIDL